MTAYQKLEARFRRMSRLSDARAILSWDEAVTMPPGSGDARTHSVAELRLIIQELGAEGDVGRWLDEAADESDPWARANVREMRRSYVDNTTIPPELNQRLNLARGTCEQRWRDLRAKNDWASFRPYLAEVLTLTREAFGHLARVRGLSLYDAALGQYSPGLTTAVVERLFTDLKSFLPDLIRGVVARQAHESVEVPEGPFPAAAQKALGRDLMTALGFRFDIGRLDESHHPFCGGTARDVRITTRYDESQFVSSLMGILHETGHALYEQSLPEAWLTQPVGAACGMAIHESQSLLHEMQVCRSPEFLAFAEPRVRAHLGASTKNPSSLDAANLARLVTRVRPSLIRVDADEVTYPMHVILRFELERALLDGSLDLVDLPHAWDERMRTYLGVSTLGNDMDGCMQDVHWPAGLFGYFPAYTFGAVIAAQFFRAASRARPTLPSDISKGDFAPLREWLKEHVWSRGSLYDTMGLVERAAGPLSTEAFRLHLERRYLER